MLAEGPLRKQEWSLEVWARPEKQRGWPSHRHFPAPSVGGSECCRPLLWPWHPCQQEGGELPRDGFPGGADSLPLGLRASGLGVHRAFGFPSSLLVPGSLDQIRHIRQSSVNIFHQWLTTLKKGYFYIKQSLNCTWKTQTIFLEYCPNKSVTHAAVNAVAQLLADFQQPDTLRAEAKGTLFRCHQFLVLS